MIRTNVVQERMGATGLAGYVVELGNILVNDRIVSLGNLSIPLRGEVFFSLPEEKGKYAVVNAYYEIETGRFVFDRVLISDKFIPFVSSLAIPNLIPIAQFVLKQFVGGFSVEAVNEYSRMATYATSQGGETGEEGLQGPLGETGCFGWTGAQGPTGIDGAVGNTGAMGPTGIGVRGERGSQGYTGVYPDLNLLMYFKFKSNDGDLIDYSAYQRDCTWSVTGVGVTGSSESSSYIPETGIVDNCHSITYRGDASSYVRDEYVDFSGYTGVIQAWVRIDVPPEVDFSYTGVAGVSGVLRFTENCSYFPETWSWEMDGTRVSTSKIFTRIVPTGEHLIKLTSSNDAGSMSRVKLVTMP